MSISLLETLTEVAMRHPLFILALILLYLTLTRKSVEQRFNVKMNLLPDSIDPSTYSTFILSSLLVWFSV